MHALFLEISMSGVLGSVFRTSKCPGECLQLLPQTFIEVRIIDSTK